MNMHRINAANTARRGTAADLSEDNHDCYEGHSHYDPFGKRGRPVNDSSLNEEWEDAVQEIGAVFKNLFNVPPPVKKQPEPEPEQEPDPVHPTIAPVEATVETEKSPMVEDLTQPVQPEVEPKVAIFDSSVPSRPMISRSMFTAEELRKSVIMSEVLGRPVSQRRGRR